MLNVVKFAAWFVGFGIGAQITSNVLTKVEEILEPIA